MMTDLIRHIISSIEEMRHSPPAPWMEESGIAYDRVLNNLDMVAELNRRGQSYCGMASDMMLELCGATLPIMTMVASAGNSCFHHFNIVTPDDGSMLVCDLTVSQFLTRPMDLLGDKPYFVGTPEELKSIIMTARDNTWRCVQESFPDKNFRSLWDVDLMRWQDGAFSIALQKAFEAFDKPCLQTENLYRPWDMTWGDSMRIQRSPRKLSDAFFKVSRSIAVTETTTAPIDNLVDWKNYKSLSLKDGPRG